MKKIICTILACGAFASAAVPAAFADELPLTAAPDKAYTVTADGKTSTSAKMPYIKRAII